jgi:hypothetical protein
VFGKFNTLLRKAGERSIAAVRQPFGTMLDVISPEVSATAPGTWDTLQLHPIIFWSTQSGHQLLHIRRTNAGDQIVVGPAMISPIAAGQYVTEAVGANERVDQRI